VIHRERTQNRKRMKLAQDHIQWRNLVKSVLGFRVPINLCEMFEVPVLEDGDKTNISGIINAIKIKLNSEISVQNLFSFISKQLTIYLGPMYN
jgi:hypothetical protein